MASSRLLVLLCLAAVAVAAAAAGEGGLRLPRDATFPAAQAERLIRALNLLPREEAGPGARGDGPSVAPGELLERRVRLPGVPDGVGDLGHHAGYFRLPHTHDAR
jgi:vitellogenic carboxypeptidase-like protein/serine carboxypeptidase-like clade 4